MFEFPFLNRTLEEEQRMSAFHPITENPIVLDFSKCRYLGEIHRILKEKFGLPDYYGENWDALWDCLDGLFWEAGVWRVEIKGFFSLDRELRDACRPMLEILDEVHQDTPNVTVVLVS